MKVGRIGEAIADVIRLVDRIERIEATLKEVTAAFRDDSKQRDSDFLDHDRRIQRIENMIEFAERVTARERLDKPS